MDTKQATVIRHYNNNNNNNKIIVKNKNKCNIKNI